MACNLETVKPTPSGHTSFRKATSPKPTQNSATNWLPSSQTSEPMGDILIQSTIGTSHLFPPLRLMINIQGSASVLFFFSCEYYYYNYGIPWNRILCRYLMRWRSYMCFCSAEKNGLVNVFAYFQVNRKCAPISIDLHIHRVLWNNAPKSSTGNRETGMHTSLFYYIFY